MTRWIVDAHAHLDDEAFDTDREEVIRRLPECGVLAVVNPGCDLETSRRAVTLSHQYERIFACVGTHPHEAQYYTAETEQAYREWAGDSRVVAIGEIGLDYHYDFSPRETQRAVFERQLDLARSLNMPVVIHTREAIQDTYDIMKNFGTGIRALMHSFSESVEMAEKFFDLGYCISLGGIATFKNAKKPAALVRIAPKERLLLETDSPYLAPVPKRGRRNEPCFANFTLEHMAQIRGVSAEELAETTVENAARFYRVEESFQALRACANGEEMR
ncbi:MAG: TatD family hydrolase [Ndongobacter sp.]|nr:TatD family hydrolase [Ndongobacter sp.]